MLLAGDKVVQLVLERPALGITTPNIAQLAGRQLEVAPVEQRRRREHQLRVREPLSETAAHAHRERVEDGAAALDAARAVVHEPALRPVREGLREVLGVVVNRVDGHVQRVHARAAVGVDLVPER